MKTIHLEKNIPPDLTHKRLDQALALMFSDYSRQVLQTWIRDGHVLVDEKICNVPKTKVKSGQKIEIHTTICEQVSWEAQAITLDIVYEDDAIIVVNKPAGLIVHPGAGNPNNTLVNALLHHAPELNQLPRAGLIHRLDKDTTGLLVIARRLEAHTQLVKAMQARDIQREYEAIVHGILVAGGKIETGIARHPVHRTRMSVSHSGKKAVTHYRIIKRFAEHSHVQIKLETGRTHQIRVHFAHINHPIVGDPVYGKSINVSKKRSTHLQELLGKFKRQALHARRLSLYHPITNKEMTWEAPLPQDMKNLLEALEQDIKNANA